MRSFWPRYIIAGVAVIVCIYFPFSIYLILRSKYVPADIAIDDGYIANRQPPQTAKGSHITPVKGHGEKNVDILMKLHNLEMEPDGSVDLTLNLNVNELISLMEAYTDGSFKGEMTKNKVVPDITYIIANTDFCSSSPLLKVLIYIHTAPDHNKRRELLRMTWARKDLFRDGRTKAVFLLGKPDTAQKLDLLLREQETYHDLVIGDFDDAYKNLSLKAVMGLKWTTTYCPRAQYIIKADDDTFINIFEILNLLQKQESQRLIMCPLWKEHTMPILRDPSKCKKWCVHFYEFPGQTHFPQYCAGLMFVMSANVVSELYKASKKTPMFWIDDIFITGVLTQKVKGIEYIDLSRNFTLKEDLAFKEYTQSKDRPIKTYVTHVRKRINFESMWKIALQRLSQETLENLGGNVLKDKDKIQSTGADGVGNKDEKM